MTPWRNTSKMEVIKHLPRFYIGVIVIALSVSGLADCAPSTKTKSGRDRLIDSCRQKSQRFARVDCGWPGISEETCLNQGCCFDSTFADTYNCFYEDKEADYHSTHLQDCDERGCTDQHIWAAGEIQNSDQIVASTLGVHTNTYSNDLGVGADAHVHLANIKYKFNDQIELNVKAGQVGANAHANLEDGLSVGVDATLAEARMDIGLNKPGLGWVGIGGQVGLSADTGIKIGLETEVKILGTGFTLGLKRGLEICLFGSCVNIG